MRLKSINVYSDYLGDPGNTKARTGELRLGTDFLDYVFHSKNPLTMCPCTLPPLPCIILFNLNLSFSHQCDRVALSSMPQIISVKQR